jgi:hypothetical protein
MRKTRGDFLIELDKQLGFIDRSCRAFDDGHVDEAIRIATAVRVLLHDKGRNVSILSHLAAKATVELLSSVDGKRPNEPPGMTPVFELPLGGMRVWSNGITSYRSTLADGREFSHVSVALWCKQTAWRTGRSALTRLDLILAAADKDGGAHVDAEDLAEYASLKRDPFGGFLLLMNPDESSKQMHLRFLRAIGDEILHSPALRAL